MKKYLLGFVKGLGICVAFLLFLAMFQEIIKKELSDEAWYLLGMITSGIYWIKYMPKNTPKAYMILALFINVFSIPFFSGYREWSIKSN